MRTREVAARAGVNAQTPRYYERREILAVPPRSPAGYRDHPASAVQVLRFVKRAQELGGSPTLLIDGVDPFAVAAQRPSLSCRLYGDETGAISGVPSLGQLRFALRAQPSDGAVWR